MWVSKMRLSTLLVAATPFASDNHELPEGFRPKQHRILNIIYGMSLVLPKSWEWFVD